MYFEPVGLGNVSNGRSCHRLSFFGKRSVYSAASQATLCRGPGCLCGADLIKTDHSHASHCSLVQARHIVCVDLDVFASHQRFLLRITK